jgi:hypothetical protein
MKRGHARVAPVAVVDVILVVVAEVIAVGMAVIVVAVLVAIAVAVVAVRAVAPSRAGKTGALATQHNR